MRTLIAAALAMLMGSACGPATPRGALAPAADSIVNQVQTLHCKGAYACYGKVRDTVAYFELDGEQNVRFVAKSWFTSEAGLRQVYDSLDRTYTEEHGTAVECRGALRLPDLRWSDGDKHVAITVWRALDDTGRYGVAVSRRFGPLPCGQRDVPSYGM